MPTSVTWNGTSRSIPNAGELNWATLSAFLVDLGTNAATTNVVKQSIRVALTTPVTVAAASDYAVVTDLTSPGAVVVNLPAGVDKQVFVIVDGKGDGATNNVTINPNGAETIGGSASLVFNHNRETVVLQYHALTTDWKILVHGISPGSVTSADISGVINPDKGGTGVSNNNAATTTRSGNFAKTETLTATTAVTYPTSGTLATLAGVEAFTNKTIDGNSNTLTVLAATQLSGATPIANGGTGQTSQTSGFDALSPTTTKGDIIVYNGTDNVRLPVGANGFGIVADSAQATGLKYTSLATDPTTTEGDMIYRTGGVLDRLVVGAVGTSIKSNGTDPVFFNEFISTTTKTANYPTTTSDDMIFCNTNAFTVTLNAASDRGGKILRIQKIGADANAITISRGGSDTILDVNNVAVTSISLTSQGQCVTLIANGSNSWNVLNWSYRNASDTSSGIVSTAAQSFAGVKTFFDGLKLDDAAAETAFTSYQQATQAVTWQGNGAGSTASSSINIAITKIGRNVTLDLPSVGDANTATNSIYILSSAAFAAAYRPSQTVSYPIIVRNANAEQNAPGRLEIRTDGIIRVYFSLDTGTAAFTNSSQNGYVHTAATYTV